MGKSVTKYQIATFIAVLFHVIGLAGIISGNDFFVKATPWNLLLMFGLLIWTQAQKNTSFFSFVAICIVVGIAVEILGVNTGYLFGNYSYGNALGYQFQKVPLIIGINWFIIMYCSAVFMHTVLMRAIRRIAKDTGEEPLRIKNLSIVVDGAKLAVFFDWIMEPAAIKLGYWTWATNAQPPLFNYGCWFLVSIILLSFFQYFQFSRHNKFAVHLLLIQLMFFLLLRTFL